MSKQFFSRPSLVRCVILSSISMLLFCLMYPLGVSALMFSPAPMALLGVRENKTWMTLGLLSATFTLWIVFGSSFALFFILGCGFLCFGLTLPLGKLEKGSESLLFCVTVSIISKMLFVVLSVALMGNNPFEIDLAALQNIFNNMYAEALSKGGQEAASLHESLTRAVTLLPYMLPLVIIVNSMLDSFINYKLCEALQRRREVTFPPLPPFDAWRFPKSILYVLVFAFLLPFLVDGSDWRLWIMLEYNLYSLVKIFFVLQGLALVWWWFSKFLPLPLRIVLIGFLSMPILNTWIAAIGFGDICFDFRTKKIKRA